MKNFQRLLCVVDPDQSYQPAVERAIALAESNQASLKVVATMESSSERARFSRRQPEQLQTELVDACLQKLDADLSSYRERIEIETEVLIGIPFLEVIREVLRQKHDLVLKVPEDPSWLPGVFGSDDMHLLRKCPCAVWMLKAESPRAYKRILAAVDVSVTYPSEERQPRLALNQQVLEIATSLALSEFAELHVVTAWDVDAVRSMHSMVTGITQKDIDAYIETVRHEHENALEALIQNAAGTLGKDAMDYVKPVRHLANGSPRREIPMAAKELQADVVVMGTVARTGISGFVMGNTAESILNQIDCSVLAIKPPGFVSPVTL